MTAKIFALACIRGVLCTLFLFPKQAFCHMLRPFGTAYFSIPKLIAAEIISLSMLGSVSQLSPQAFCAVIQATADQFFWRGFYPFFYGVPRLRFLFDFSDVSSPQFSGRGRSPSRSYHTVRSEGLVVIHW